jgi:2-isopropylmalate synthase
MASQVELYDTTLRDGMQGEGMSLSAGEKLRVAHRLDELGIDLIEAGFPSSNPNELELFELLARESFAHAQVAAFGMTRRRDVTADRDVALRTIADCFAPVCTIVGKTWGLHLEKVVKVDRAENLRMIGDSVAFLVAEGKRVVYDAEHFFDGFADDRDYALDCLRAAAAAGAETVVCCDTNGGTLPHVLGAATAEVVAAMAAESARVGIHTHDDAGCGVANALAAVLAGAVHVQGTMNGYGERCGNANLISIIPNLQLKLGYECLTEEQLASLTAASTYVAELLNVPPDPDGPYVGRNAFAHKGGMHVAGVSADPATFEHIPPEIVGNRREVLVSELSGRGTVQSRARDAGLELDDAAAARMIERVKELEHAGYHFEAADGSFELLMRRETGAVEPLFTLESWRPAGRLPRARRRPAHRPRRPRPARRGHVHRQRLRRRRCGAGGRRRARPAARADRAGLAARQARRDCADRGSDQRGAPGRRRRRHRADADRGGDGRPGGAIPAPPRPRPLLSSASAAVGRTEDHAGPGPVANSATASRSTASRRPSEPTANAVGVVTTPPRTPERKSAPTRSRAASPRRSASKRSRSSASRRARSHR